MPAQTKTPVTKPSSLKTLLTWAAPERPFKKRSREYFTTIGAIVFLVGVILLFLQEWLLILVMVALMFVAYIMSTVEPRQIEHQITSQGIITGGKKYEWATLNRFWFTEKWGEKILQIETLVGLPRRLFLLLGETKQEEIKKILADYLPFEEPEQTWIDNASEWISRRVPLESSS
ncbi:MAG: hypothetical protein MUP45_04220 [Candidatus Marinimicrobia bacterium]|nr:hypothetical protein [Candidatus Neomarinimicrobiota bacterium]